MTCSRSSHAGGDAYEASSTPAVRVIILPEVEPVFRLTGRYSALYKLYSERGDDAASLEVLSTCAGSSPRRMLPFCFTIGTGDLSKEWTDAQIPDPLSDVFALLTARAIRR